MKQRELATRLAVCSTATLQQGSDSKSTGSQSQTPRQHSAEGHPSQRTWSDFVLSALVPLVILSVVGCGAFIDYAQDTMDYYNAGNYDMAIAFGQAGTQDNPTDARIWYWLGLSYQAKNQVDEALEAFRTVVAWSNGLQALHSYSWIAAIYVSKGRYDEAISSAKQGIALYEAKQTPEDFGTQYIGNHAGRLRLLLGWSYYYKRMFGEAVDALDKVIHGYIYGGYPEDVKEACYRKRGLCYLEQKRYLEALHDFDHSIKSIHLGDRGALPEALNGRGWANYYLGYHDIALKDFNRALENIDPTAQSYKREMFRGKAFAYLGLGDKETAVGLINRIKEFDKSFQPENDLMLIAYAWGDKETAWKYRGGNGYIGVRVKDYKKGGVEGAEITEVIKNSPAQKLGLLNGDIITGLNNERIWGDSTLTRKSRVLVAGTTAHLRVMREEIERELPIKIESAEPLLESDPLIATILRRSLSEAFRDKSTSYRVIHRVSASRSLDRVTQVIVDPEGRHVYYVANTGGVKNQGGRYSGGVWSIWSNEKRISPELGGIGWASCSEDGSHIAYPVERLGKWSVWIDSNKVSPEFDEVADLRFVPNKSKVVYRGKIGGQYSVWVNEQKVSADFEVVTGVALNPDGLRIAYGAKRWGKYAVWVNDRKVSLEFDRISFIVFTDDGSKLAYGAQSGSGEFVMVNEQRISPTFDSVYQLSFSSDGSRVAYIAFEMGSSELKSALYVDNKRISPESVRIAFICRPVFSADCLRVAYVVYSNQGGKALYSAWINDQKVSPDLDLIGADMVFGPDGKTLAYTVWKGERYSVWIDNTVVSPDFDQLGFAGGHFEKTGELIFAGYDKEKHEILHAAYSAK